MIDEWTITTDCLLDGLDLEWRVGISTIARWNVMADYEQMVFIEEWAIPRGYYQELQARCEQGRLQHRPAIEAVLEAPAI
jgi:hypothetical protein